MLAGLLGVIPSGVVGGIGTILISLLWMRLFPTLRKVDSLSIVPDVRAANVQQGIP
jgi:hypothetical protein